MLIGANSPTQGFTDRGRAAAESLGPQIMLWLDSAEPANAVRYPNCVHILRCVNWLPGMSEPAYISFISPLVTKWRSAIPDIILQLGNEPDLESGHNGQEIRKYADAVHAAFPGIRIGNPPLSVEKSNLANFDGCDVRLVHSYFERQHPEDMGNPQFGASYLHALSGAGTIPVYVTEFNVVQTNCPIDWSDRNKQVAAWMDQAEAAGVDGVCLFILDGMNEWASFDVGAEAAQEILSSRQKPMPAPPPPPPPPNPSVDYLHFRGLSWEQYQQIVNTGTIPGRASPMLNRADYDALIGVMQASNIDPRLPLAFTWAEGHQGSDPGLVAASVNNLGGIKYVGAPGTYDSGIVADTGGTYAGFYDLRPYYAEWARIMNNEIIGPDFRSGNLIGAVEHYTNGPGTGHNKVDKYNEYVSLYPEAGVSQPTSGVTGAMVAAEAMTQLGQVMAGSYDTHNGNHPWYLWCQSFVERVHEHVGITGPYYDSAADCGRAMEAMGLMRHDKPLIGGVLFFDETFWAAGGHTMISLGDGTAIGTTSGGIQIGPDWTDRAGYMGWAFRPGVSDQVAEDTDVHTDGKFDDGRIKRLWDGPKTKAAIKSVGGYDANRGIDDRWTTELKAGKPLGFAVSKEEKDASTGIVIRYFSNGFICWYPDGTSTVN